jgi:hypothetical protein
MPIGFSTAATPAATAELAELTVRVNRVPAVAFTLMRSDVEPRQKDTSSPTRTSRLRFIYWSGVLVLAMLMLLTSIWSLAALYFDSRNSVRKVLLPCAYLFAVTAIWLRVKGRALACGLILACFGIVLAWWLLIPPSNMRDWQPDVALLPFAEINANQVQVHNIRYCNYRSETDFDVRHYDKTFDLEKIRSIDLFLVYWGSPLIAHTMVSFGFAAGDPICFSIETRKEKGESYSALRGFFRQFELTYVIADERDLVRLRTDFRNEQVYLYRLRASPEKARALFLEYLREANELYRKPRWYNALTDNCTTNIRVLADQAYQRHSSLDWRTIVNGYADQMLYERGRLDTSLGFDDLKKRGHINDRARAASENDFSQEIRKGLPLPE